MDQEGNSLRIGIWARFRSWLFGYDIFISYRHADALGYAMALENRLAAADLSCFRDAREIPSGSSLKEEIEKALKRSKMLVVVCSEAATEPESWVPWELEVFAALKRVIVPINIGTTLDGVDWPQIEGLRWVAEEQSSLHPPQPGEPVIEAISSARRFSTRNSRTRQLTGLTAILIVALAVGVGWFSMNSAAEAESRRIAEVESRARSLAAESNRLRTFVPNQIEEAGRAGIEALELSDTIETGAAVRSLLDVWVPLSSEVRLPCGEDHIAWSKRNLVVAGPYSFANAGLCILPLELGASITVVPFPKTVRSVSVSADGHVIAATYGGLFDRNRSLVIHSDSGAQMCAPIDDEILGIAVSPDGSVVIAASKKKIIRYSLKGCVLSEESLAVDNDIEEVFADPTGRFLVTRSDNELALWDGAWNSATQWIWSKSFAEGDIPFTKKPPFAFNQDGTHFAWSAGGEVVVLELPGRSVQSSFSVQDVDGLAFSGHSLAIHRSDDSFLIWNLKFSRFDTPDRLLQGEMVVSGSWWTPDGHLVSHATGRGTTASALKIIDPELGIETGRLFHEKRVRGAVFLEDELAVSVGAKGEVRFWNLELKQPELSTDYDIDAWTVTPGADRVSAVSGFICSRCRKIRTWDVATGSVLAELSIPNVRGVVAMKHLTHHEVLLVTSSALYRWNVTDNELTNLLPFEEVVTAAAFSDDGSMIAIIDGKGNGHLLESPYQELRGPFRYSDSYSADPWDSRAVTFRPDGLELAIAIGGIISRVDLTKNQLLSPYRTYYRLRAVTYSPDGKRLALPGLIKPEDDRSTPASRLELVNLETLKAETAPVGSDVYFSAIDVSHDGKQIALGLGSVIRVVEWLSDGSVGQTVHQIELPWVIQELQFDVSDRLLTVRGDSRIRRVILDRDLLLSEARARQRTSDPTR